VAQSRTYTVYELESLSGFDKRTITYYISEGLLPKIGRRGPKTTYPQEFLDRLMFIKRCRDLQDAGQLRAVTLAEIADAMQALPADEFHAVAQGQRSDDWIRERFVAPNWDTSGRARSAERVAAGGEGDYAREAPDRTAFSRPPGLASMRQRRERMQRQSESPEERSWSLKDLRNVITGLNSADTMDSAKAETPAEDWDALPELSFGAADTPAELARLGELMRMVQQRAQAATQQTTDYSGERLIRVPISDDIMLSVRHISEEDAPLVEELCQVLKKVMGST